MTTIRQRIFGWMRPRSLRSRPHPEENAERNDATLSRLNDQDPVYRALTDHAHGLFVQSIYTALAPETPPDKREYACGQAHGLLVLLEQIESTRERALEALRQSAARSQRLSK